MIKLPVNKRPRVTSEAQARAILQKVAALQQLTQVNALAKQVVELTPERKQWFFDRFRNPETGEAHQGQVELLSSTARFKAILCPRRWGKTTYTLIETLYHCERFPKSTIAYIVPDSRGHARRLFWRPLKELNEQLKLGLTFYETDKRVTHPNGTDILLFAAHDKDSPAQLRGDRYSLVILDECKDFGPHFEELIVESVLPGLGDYQGTLVLAGTPGATLAGLFYRVTTARPEGWFVRVGIKSENPFNPPEERDLDRVFKTTYEPFGLDRDSPKFKREQLAEWVTDDSERVYAYDNRRNDWDGVLPEGGHKWMYCLGLDLGERDANAFVVGAFAPTCKHLYIVDQYARAAMSIDELAEKYRELETKHGTFAFAVADTGGYGRGIVTDLQNRHGLPVEPADKGKNKLGNIAVMNSDFISGKIKCPKDTPLAKEWLKLVRRIRPSDNKIILDHTDLGDAALYMHKAALHWTGQEVTPEPLPGTEDYWRKLEQAAITRFVENQNSRGKALSER